jgi:hypothetical protein
MKRYFNERTLQVLLCLVLIGVAVVTWQFAHSRLLCMLACVTYTSIWIGVGFWTTGARDRAKALRAESGSDTVPPRRQDRDRVSQNSGVGNRGNR